MKIVPTTPTESQQPSGEGSQAAFQSIDRQLGEVREFLKEMSVSVAQINESLGVLSRLVLAEQSEKPPQQQQRRNK